MFLGGRNLARGGENKEDASTARLVIAVCLGGRYRELCEDLPPRSGGVRCGNL